jgi:hypothetical protein
MDHLTSVHYDSLSGPPPCLCPCTTCLQPPLCRSTERSELPGGQRNRHLLLTLGSQATGKHNFGVKHTSHLLGLLLLPTNLHLMQDAVVGVQ